MVPCDRNTSKNLHARDEKKRKIAELYDQHEIVSEIIPDYDLGVVLLRGKKWMEDFRTKMVYELAGNVNMKRVLDIGCQYGLFSFYLASKGAYVTGLDISRNWIKRFVEEAQRASLVRKTDFVVADAQELPFSDESFDVVLCFSTAATHHMLAFSRHRPNHWVFDKSRLPRFPLSSRKPSAG